MIAAEAMMNDDNHRFPEQAVEGKVFDTAPGISSCEQGKIVVSHNGRVPHISNRNRAGISIVADGIVVNGSDEICSSQYSHGRFGKNALREDHYPVMSETGGNFMLIHSFKRLSCFCVKIFGIVAQTLPANVRATVHEIIIFGPGSRIAERPAPVPRNECDVGGKLIALHE